MNTVTYTLENDTKIQQPINKESIVDFKSRKKSIAEMHKMFNETAWDKRAVSYTLDSETNDSVVIKKEIHFSKLDKKLAKAQYKEFMKSNPEGFKKSLKLIQKQLVNMITNKNRIRMNIRNIILQ